MIDQPQIQQIANLTLVIQFSFISNYIFLHLQIIHTLNKISHQHCNFEQQMLAMIISMFILNNGSVFGTLQKYPTSKSCSKRSAQQIEMQAYQKYTGGINNDMLLQTRPHQKYRHALKVDTVFFIKYSPSQSEKIISFRIQNNIKYIIEEPFFHK